MISRLRSCHSSTSSKLVATISNRLDKVIPVRRSNIIGVLGILVSGQWSVVSGQW
ncbi:hypothetical protein [Argonema antarcticum]|uniref:hypothetical protein n=1 Tax=Argonema antarcticum TaxID=2942763 RepID=UPI0020117F62|nr:hypothetical protein [Argonema antarcticum]